jgi:hypothetical protein
VGKVTSKINQTILHIERHPMDIAAILEQSGGIASMAKELGVDQNAAAQGAAALLPAIMGGFKKNAQQGSGLEGMMGMLGGMGGGALLEQVLGSSPTPVENGNNILGQIFGSKEVSRSVASHASSASGVDSGLLKKMLPILTMMVAGYMAKQGGRQSAPASSGMGGMLGNVLGSVLGGGQQQAAPASGGLGGLANMLDFNGDGNPLDDIMSMASKFGS